MDLQSKYLLIQGAYKFSLEPGSHWADKWDVRELLESRGFFGATDYIIHYAKICNYSVEEDLKMRYKDEFYLKTAIELQNLPW